jgi:coenzyme PQQ precursor peptide PqqA
VDASLYNCYKFGHPRGRRSQTMWRKPKLVEIAVGMEINAYACAEIA